MSPEQRREIEKFRDTKVQTRKELRNVQHELTKNIERLGGILKFMNIVLIPLLIVVIATWLGVRRMRRAQRKG